MHKPLYEPELAEYMAKRYRDFETDELIRRLRSRKLRVRTRPTVAPAKLEEPKPNKAA